MTSTILHGDCTKVIPRLQKGSVDLVLTDPPYIVNYRSRDGRAVANDNTGIWLRPAFHAIYDLLKQDAVCICFYGWNSADLFIDAWKSAGFRIVGHFVFRKRYASSTRYARHCHEQAYLLAKGQPAIPAQPIDDVIDWTYTGNRLHPTEKSPEILKPLIRAFSAPGDVVCDPFCGSGSTLVAAELLDRRGLGIELDRCYHRSASRRLDAITSAFNHFGDASVGWK